MTSINSKDRIRWRFALSFIAILPMLGACGGDQTPSANQIARDTVKAVLKPTISSQFPGVPTDIVVDCVVDNATTEEILRIANSALIGSSTDSLYAILPIAQRPETIQCVTTRALLG